MGRYVPRLAVALADAAGVAPGCARSTSAAGPAGSRTSSPRGVGRRPRRRHRSRRAVRRRLPRAQPGRRRARRRRRGAAVGRRRVRRRAVLARDRLHARRRRGRARDGAGDAARRRRGRVHVGHPGRRDDDAEHVLAGGGDGRPVDAGRAGAGRRARGRDRRACSSAPGSTTCERGTLATAAHYEDFDDFWQPFTFAVGPAGNDLRSRPRRAAGRDPRGVPLGARRARRPVRPRRARLVRARHGPRA